VAKTGDDDQKLTGVGSRRRIVTKYEPLTTIGTNYGQKKKKKKNESRLKPKLGPTMSIKLIDLQGHQTRPTKLAIRLGQQMAER
jgi:23S rRNA pseudoU1915 N3-methylase RlmH